MMWTECNERRPHHPSSVRMIGSDSLLDLRPGTVLAITALVLVTAALLLPPDPRVRTRLVAVLAVALVAAVLVVRDRRALARDARELRRRQRRSRKAVAQRTGGNAAAAAPIDPESYALRVPDDGRGAARAVAKAVARDLVPSPLLVLARRVRNQAAGKRMVAAALDVHARCRYLDALMQKHGRGSVSVPKSVETRASNEIGLLQASRRLMLNSAQELTMRLPGGQIARAYAGIVRGWAAESQRRVQRVCKEWDWSLSARAAAAMHACDHRASPQPYEPGRESLLW